MNPQPSHPGHEPAPPYGYQPQGAPPPPPMGWPPSEQPPLPTPGTPGKTLAAPTLFQIVAGVLTIVALVLSSDGQESWYESTTAWAVFATIAAIVQLAPSLAKTTGWTVERSWTVGAGGAGGLFAWWVLIALPAVATNQGFTATMAVAAALIGSWLAPGRRL